MAIIIRNDIKATVPYLKNMKKKIYIILICSLVSMGFHIYLSERSYSIASDKVDSSTICHINNTWNCDNSLTSSYSEFLGIPLSNWGFSTHVIIALLSLLLLIGWTENATLIWLTLSCVASLSAGASLVMLSISLFVLNLFCPFCVILYVLSFVIAISAFPAAKHSFSFLSFKKARLLLPGTFITLIITAIITHLIFMNTYNIKSVDKIVRSNVMDWSSSPVKYSKETPLLTAGPSREKASVIITEFADFLCSYCRKSYYILKLFKASHPQVRIEYFSFPLNQCKSESASCSLTRAVHCAEKQNQGWNIHKVAFENQKTFSSLKERKKVFQKIKELGKKISLNWDQWLKCANSPSAIEAQNKQIKAGNDMNVIGTPSLFINGKKVNNRYLTKTLNAILKKKILPSSQGRDPFYQNITTD